MLWGETLLLALLGAALALFLAHPSLRTTSELPQLRLIIDTSIVLAATLVAVLAGIRFTLEGRRLEVLLFAGFAAAAAGGFAFSVLPTIDGDGISRSASWAALGSGLVAGTLIAAAPFARGRVRSRAGLGTALATVGVLLARDRPQLDGLVALVAV